MQAIQIAATATKIADPGNRDFLHIYNISDEVIYVAYDGNTAPTVAAGMPVLPGTMLALENLGPRAIYTRAVYAIHGAVGNREVRVQGI
jgi:hypothetical protein